MKSLIFDTETTGFPANPSNKPLHEQPYMIELSMQLCRGKEMEVEDEWTSFIKGGTIPDPSTKQGEFWAEHGLTQEKVDAGVELEEALKRFDNMLADANVVICHNVAFDFKIMQISYGRLGMEWNMRDINTVCTMLSAKEVVGAVTKTGKPKNPNLREAFTHFNPTGDFKEHSALGDVTATREVMKGLVAIPGQEFQSGISEVDRYLLKDYPLDAYEG